MIICWQDSMENQACSQFIIFISLYICMAIFLWFLGKYKITLIYVREAIFKNNEIAPKRYLFSSNMVGYANKSGEKKVRAAENEVEKKIGCRGVYNQTVMFIGHKSIWAFCENVLASSATVIWNWQLYLEIWGINMYLERSVE